MISNKTDTPCLFKIDLLKGPFDVYPKIGFIKKNKYVNIIVKFQPKN